MFTMWRRFRSWLWAVVQRSRMERDMDAELRFHIEAFAEDLVRSGVEPEEAQRRARVEFGGVELAKEECRDARGVNFIESMLEDVRYGIRTLSKNPGFTAVAVLILGLGIGANAAIFNTAEAVLWRTLRVKDAQSLVRLVVVTQDRDERYLPVELAEELRR